MSQHADHQPRLPDASPAAGADDPASLFCPEVAELVAIAAAVAANCEPCLRHHVREAERCGVSREDIDRAVALAVQVKDTPQRNILALARRLTGVSRGGASDASPGTSCCGGPGV